MSDYAQLQSQLAFGTDCADRCRVKTAESGCTCAAAADAIASLRADVARLCGLVKNSYLEGYGHACADTKIETPDEILRRAEKSWLTFSHARTLVPGDRQ